MRGQLKKEGHYELFETTAGHRILTLDSKSWYAVVKGQKSDILVGSDSQHEKKKTIREGKYYFADFEDDPAFKDMPHLFMKDGNTFREYVLPNKLPSKKGEKVRMVRSGEKLSVAKVMEHVKGKGRKGAEKQYKGEPEWLRTRTKSELYDMAKKMDIHGRSKMNKEELVQAVSKHEGSSKKK